MHASRADGRRIDELGETLLLQREDTSRHAQLTFGWLLLTLAVAAVFFSAVPRISRRCPARAECRTEGALARMTREEFSR